MTIYDDISQSQKKLTELLPDNSYGRFAYGEVNITAEYVAATEAEVMRQIAVDLRDIQQSSLDEAGLPMKEVTVSILAKQTYIPEDDHKPHYISVTAIYSFTPLPSTDNAELFRPVHDVGVYDWDGDDDLGWEDDSGCPHENIMVSGICNECGWYFEEFDLLGEEADGGDPDTEAEFYAIVSGIDLSNSDDPRDQE